MHRIHPSCGEIPENLDGSVGPALIEHLDDFADLDFALVLQSKDALYLREEAEVLLRIPVQPFFVDLELLDCLEETGGVVYFQVRCAIGQDLLVVVQHPHQMFLRHQSPAFRTALEHALVHLPLGYMHPGTENCVAPRAEYFPELLNLGCLLVDDPLLL